MINKLNKMEQAKKVNSLQKAKDYVKKKMEELKIQFYELKKLDNTNPDVILAILKIKKDNNLLLKSFNILSKEDLSQFGIIKKLSNRDTYFYFLQYIITLEITNEDIKDEEKEDNDSYISVNSLSIDLSAGKTDIIYQSDNKTNNKEIDYEKNEKSFNEIIQKKNINIEEIFPMNEKITIKELRKKIQDYYKQIALLDDYKNNYPDFESELFFHYQLKNILKLYEELNDINFMKKINLTKELTVIINKVEKNKIKDKIILIYFYLVMDLEYEINPDLMISALNNYDENDIKYKDASVDLKANKLLINDTDIIIENFDYYKLDDNIIQMVKEGIIKLPLGKGLYSLKGYLLLRELNSEQGNIIYEKFLPSNLVKDLFFLLYEINDNIFDSKDLIKLYQDNTYYFPISNKEYYAYTDKECFNIFIDFKIEIDSNLINLNLNDDFYYFIKKSFMIVNIQHEFGHNHKLIICRLNTNKIIYFDSPIVEMKLNKEKTISIEEGGELFEYLLYGRVIEEINIKEIIYILNFNNNSKNLTDFRNDFLNLEKETVIEVFNREGKDNYEISRLFETYKKLPNEVQNILEKVKFKSGKRRSHDTQIDFETITFSSGKRRKCHNKNKRKHVISKFNSDATIDEKTDF